MTVTMAPVKSSNIEAIGYDPASRELHVKFKSGGYVYADVAPDKHAALMKAESKGKHVHEHIRPHHKARKA